ncbi:MAG: hypothetical protein ACLFR9_09320, partial [Desulfobacterales bacterium]
AKRALEMPGPSAATCGSPGKRSTRRSLEDGVFSRGFQHSEGLKKTSGFRVFPCGDCVRGV